MKRIEQFFLCSFFLLITAPVVLFFAFYPSIPRENTENKTPASLPQLSVQNYSSFSNQFEEWFSDHLPFKTQLIQAHRNLEKMFFNRLDNSNVIIGEDGWLFYKINVNQYKGLSSFSDEELTRINDNVTYLRDWLGDGCDNFVFYLGPDKELIYSEKMPAYYKRLSEKSRGDQVFDYFTDHSDINMIYPKQEFIRLRDGLPLYFVTDTHWTDLAGYFVVEQLDNIIQQSDSMLVTPEFRAFSDSGKDLAIMSGIQNRFSERNAVEITGRRDVSLQKISSVDHGAIQRFHSESGNPRKLIVFGDSFGEYAVRSAVYQYNDVIFISYRNLSKIDLDAEKPFDFLMLFAERNLPQLLDSIY